MRYLASENAGSLAGGALLFMCLASVALCANASQPAPAGQWQQKVAPVLLEKTAGGSLEFLVFLTEQADLAPAASLSSKLEKGNYAFETLRAVAARTQPPVVEVLEAEGAGP